MLSILIFLAASLYLLWLLPFWGIPFNSSRHQRVPLTPAWALECWLWEDDSNTAAAAEELLQGYARHDIPVRTLLIDSPWSRRYNDFVFDQTRYPNPAAWLRSLHSRNYKVVLWMTCMVNSRNKDTEIRDATNFFEHARTNSFLAGGGHQLGWWKGRGGFIDYSSPDAMKWWHGLQKPLFEIGIDGWKLDGTDTLFSGPGFLPYQKMKGGWFSTRSYMDLYNREEFRHGLKQNPEFIVMTRAVDDRYFPLSHPEGFAPMDAAPVTWVGDRTHEWSSRGGGKDSGVDAMRKSRAWKDRGFEGALRDILASSRLGYAVVGCDIAGYHGKEPIPPRLYIRWAEFACFTGFFLNGGHGERRLWMRSAEELSIIRKYSWLHTELVPYLYTLVTDAHLNGRHVIEPVEGPYHYMLGESIFVAPIHRDTNSVEIQFPKGRWRNLLDDRELLEGPREIVRDFALDEFPAYVREGAIIPLNVSRDYTGFGSTNSVGKTTWCLWPEGTNAFTLHNPDKSGTTTLRSEKSVNLLIDFHGVRKPHLLRIFTETKPSSITAEGVPMQEGPEWHYEASRKHLWITPERPFEHYVIR